MTQIKLYDTMRREKVPFEPIDPTNVRMYVCGPTVYDHAHIGNARPVVVFDVLFRLLRHVYGAQNVVYVRNITDVDDKINARAVCDFPKLPLNDAIANVTEKTTAQFHADVAALGCLPPSHEPRATEHIAGMVELIGTLVAKGHAYVADGPKGVEVLFDVSSDANYGTLSNRRLDEQQAGARVAVESHKRDPGDFVLWKASDDDEPGWDATFDGRAVRGRPGWHIECSAMSKHHLGDTFDIHGGGLDLIFPHHENEIAQSCCANGTDRMANVWMHNGYLQVEGRKMSKSEGNFVTISDLLHTEKVGGRKWPGAVVRLALLMTHYREPMDFSVRRLESIDRWFADLRDLLEPHVGKENSVSEAQRSELSIDGPSGDLVYVLSQDLTTTAIDTHFLRLKAQAAGKFGTYISKRAAVQMLVDFEFLGVNYAALSAFEAERKAGATLVGGSDLEMMIAQRLELIAAKKWGEADAVRDALLTKGIQLKDGKDPDTGERTTTWEVVR